MYKQVYLGDTSIFAFITLKTAWTFREYTAFDTKNETDYPVYTAIVDPVAYVDIQSGALIEASEQSPVISFGANGDASAGTNFVLHERPFYVSNDRTCLKVLDPKLVPRYMIYALSNMKRDYGFDFQYKAVPKNIKEVALNIPLTDEGEFDSEQQLVIVARIAAASSLQNIIASEINRLRTARLLMSLDYTNMREIGLSDTDCFSTFIGKRLLKTEVVNEGIPVYSANVEVPFGFVAESNITDFSKPALLWGIDWIYNWNYIPEGMAFATTDHCGTIYVQHPALDPKYVYFALKTTQDQYDFDRTYRASLSHVRSTVTVQVPALADGSFDLSAQREAVAKYERLLSWKHDLVEQCSVFLSSQIVVGDSANQTYFSSEIKNEQQLRLL